MPNACTGPGSLGERRGSDAAGRRPPEADRRIDVRSLGTLES